MVAATANLLAQNAVPPALVYLLLDTASEINSMEAHLADPRTFLNAFKLAPVLHTYRLKSQIFCWYEQLTEVDVERTHHGDPAHANRYLARLDVIESEIKAAHLPSWLREQAYRVRGAIGMVREQLRAPEAPAVAIPPGSSEPPRHDTNLGTLAGLA